MVNCTLSFSFLWLKRYLTSPSWRKLRRAGREGLNARAAEKYKPLQEVEAAAMVVDILKEPNHWDHHLKRWAYYFALPLIGLIDFLSTAASATLSAVYGWPPIELKDDPLVSRINDLMHRAMQAALPGAYLVEIFPVMKHLPTWMAPWKKWGLEWYKKDTEMFQGLYDGVAKTLVSWKIRTRTRECSRRPPARRRLQTLLHIFTYWTSGSTSTVKPWGRLACRSHVVWLFFIMASKGTQCNRLSVELVQKQCV